MINQANKGDKKERERRSIHGELYTYVCMYVCVRPLEAVAGNTESPILNVN